MTTAQPWSPHPWQLDAIKFLVAQSHGGLFYDMGLGKTAACLAAMTVLKKKGFIKKTLVIAPIRALSAVWPKEIEKWAEFRHLTTINLHDHPGDLHKQADIHLINPERVPKLFNQLGYPKFDHLIVDESSMFKAPDTQRFRALRRVLPMFERRWILTGTPAPNGLVDVWSQIYLLDQGAALGKFISHFRSAFCTSDFFGHKWEVLPNAVEEIYQRMAPLVLRRSVGDGGVDMPDLLKNSVPVILPDPARAEYLRMEKHFYAIVKEETIHSPNAAAAGMRCRQLSSGAIYGETHAVRQVHVAKMAALHELLTVLEDEKRPALVFYEFKHEAERVEQLFPDTPTLSGMTSARQVTQLVDDFNAGKIPRLLAYPAAAGYALNLQEKCRDVVFITPPWDLAGYNQGIARVWRQGQKSGVTVHHIVAQDTLDETVMTVLGDKSATQTALLDAMRAAEPLAKQVVM